MAGGVNWLQPQQSLVLVLSLLFCMSAVAKIVGLPGSLRHRQRLGVPIWLWRLTGWGQLLGVVGLWSSLVQPRYAWWAGIWLVLIMIGAAIAHWRVGDAWHHYITVGVLSIFSLAVVVFA